MAVKVEKYVLNMDFTLGESGYSGTEIITLSNDSPTIEMDSKGIDILSLKVNGATGKYDYNGDKKKLIISGVESGNLKIEIAFKRSFSESLAGLYLAGQGNRRIITTQFESTDASLAFPCFDRPDVKAIFEISMRIPGDKEAIGNMPIKSVKKDGEYNIVEFLPTPVMSTYLLYMGVGKFKTKTTKYKDIEITLAIPGDELNSNDFPLEIASKSLEFYENYFGIPFELPKVHLISVPDFAAGAMENWGAITFREEALVCNDNTDLDSRINIGVTIAHELAHQWFGNLVTMKWWNDLWLNESFATFMEMLCLNAIHPEYDVIKSTYLSQTVTSMTSDSLRSTHPINAKVESPDDIQQIFDEISYGKGGSILRMIHNYVGDENFRKGVSAYLSKFKYSNAEGSDLWNSIGEVSKLPVSEIMSDWINQPGLPAIRVTPSGKKLKLEQRRYFMNDQHSDLVWRIPLSVKGTKGIKNVLMDAKSTEIDKGDYVKLNSDGNGFFRVIYEEEFYTNLKDKVQFFSDIDRAEIVNDSYSLLLSGKITVDKYFRILNDLVPGVTTPVITLVQRNLDNAMSILFDRENFRKSAISMLKTILSELGEKSSNEESLKSITRQKIRETLASYDHDFAAVNAINFNEYFNTPPEDRQALALSKATTSEDIEDLKSIYSSAKDDTDRNKLIIAMGSMKGKKNHKALMKMVMKGEVKRQDSPWAVIALIRNPDSRKYMLSIFKYIINSIRKEFAGTGFGAQAMQVSIPLLGIVNEKKIRKLVAVLNGPDVSMGVSKGLEMLDIYLNFRKYN